MNKEKKIPGHELKMFTIIYRAFKNVIFLLLLPVLNLDGVSRSQKQLQNMGNHDGD